MRIPSSLIAATRNGDIVPLIGSGLSQASGMTSWDEIVSTLRKLIRGSGRFGGPVDLDAFETPDAFRRRFKGGGYSKELSQIIEEAVGRGFKPNALHRLLSDMPFRTFLTTNWDSLLEDALSTARRVNVIFGDESARNWRESQATQIIKFHGTHDVPSSLVFGLSDYSRLYQKPSLLMSLVRTLISTRPVLSLGFGMRDPFVKSLFHAVGDEVGSEHFVVVSEVHVKKARRDYLEEVGLTVVETKASAKDPFGLESFLKHLWQQTYVEARNRVDRTGLLVRETRRLEHYLGHDRTVRARAAMGPLAVPETNVFGSVEVYNMEKKLLETVLEMVGKKRGKFRLICCPLDGGAHSARKGYSAEAHRARLKAFVKWAQHLGSAIEIVMADRPSDMNDWIVADMALIESRKSVSKDGRLYNYGRLEVSPNVVSASVRRFDEEFESLASRAGGVDAAKARFFKLAEGEIGHRAKGKSIKRGRVA